ncbi:MAG: hypothetical protein AAGA70_14030 [Pseudomonadota bacterium]
MPKTDTDTGALPFPPITLVKENWLEDFNDLDGTDAQKGELIQALWIMMLTCVDICRSLPSTQETGGQPIRLADMLGRAVLYSEERNLPSRDDTNEDVSANPKP